MISFIRGKIISKQNTYIILETNNIGYQVYIGANFAQDLKLGQEVETFIHHRVREEASDLYGFPSLDDLELFELLLTVSGVGPKSALGVLNIASSDDIKEAIIRGDAGLLTKVAGIGKKTAERLVLELKNKVVRLESSTEMSTSSSLASGDEIDALMNLGYSLSEARQALQEVSDKISDSGERIKIALRKMAKK